MRFRSYRWMCWGLGIALGPGCLHPVRENVDRVVCDLAARPMDVPPPYSGNLPDARPAPATPAADTGSEENIELVVQQQPVPQKPPKPFAERLQIPPELPGANAPPVRLPPPTAPRKEKEE